MQKTGRELKTGDGPFGDILFLQRIVVFASPDATLVLLRRYLRNLERQ